MRKITYIILSICLCTAGLGTAAHLSPNTLLRNSLIEEDSLITAINDSIDEEYANEDEEEENYEEEEDEFDEEGYTDEEGEEGEEEYDEEEGEEEGDAGFFTEEEEDEFGEMHDDFSTAEDSISNDIELTEGMRVSEQEMLQSYSAQNYLSGDTVKYEFKETDADVYIDRLRRMPVIMDMPYNDVVRKYIDQYTKRMQRSVSIMLGAQNFYTPIFEEALETQGIPLELKYLPVIESAYNPLATSPVGAAGLWQFMPSTGKQYGLEINSLIDERRDPIKSSNAAARLLKYLYKYYEDWTLVIAAYNCGIGNVNKAIQRAGGAKDYWAIYNYLPKETRGYVPAFIAANYVMTYYCEHGIIPLQAKLPAETDTIVVNRDVHFKQIADLCEVSIEQIKDLNPQYRAQIVPGYWKPSAIRLPVEAVTKFIACGDSIYTYQASELLPRRSVAIVSAVTPAPARTTATSTPQRTTYTRTSNSARYRTTGTYGRGNYTAYKGKSTASRGKTTAQKAKTSTNYRKTSTKKKPSSSYSRSSSYKKTSSKKAPAKKAPAKKAPAKKTASKNYSKKAPAKRR